MQPVLSQQPTSAAASAQQQPGTMMFSAKQAPFTLAAAVTMALQPISRGPNGADVFLTTPDALYCNQPASTLASAKFWCQFLNCFLFFAFLVAATVGALILLLYWFRRLRDGNWTVILGISLILGGAVGNLIDRLRYREVIDFLDFYVGPYHWPAFNLADSAITVGTIGVALNMLFSPSMRP